MFYYFIRFKPSKRKMDIVFVWKRGKKSEDLDVFGEKILKMVLEKECVKEVDSIMWLFTGQGEECNKSGDKAFGSTNFRRFLEEMRSY
jgi:hypothetical protein